MLKKVNGEFLLPLVRKRMKQELTIADCDNDLLREVIAQMEKEFAMAGERLQFISKDALSLVKELAHWIKGQNGIENLLYRVDVSLHKIESSLPYDEALAIALWERVFQKVWFRKQFANKKID